MMFAPPRLYEGMTRQVQVKYIDSTWIKRKIYEFATKVGYKVADLKFEKKARSLALEIPELAGLHNHAEKAEGPSRHVATQALLHGWRSHGAGPFPVFSRPWGST